MKKIRADLAIVKKGKAPSRAKAQELIELGLVEISKKNTTSGLDQDWVQIKKSNQEVDEDLEIRILSDEQSPLNFVSRAGLKLNNFLENQKIVVQDFRILDLGQSTGGFTDCLLQKGAIEVIGIDVGSGQLAESIRNNPRVKYFENTDAREWRANPKLSEVLLKDQIDLIVMDVSFISIELIVPQYLGLGNFWITLVKPQYEMGINKLNKSKVIDSEAYLHEKINHLYNINQIKLLAFVKSQTVGREGTQEYFAYGKTLKGPDLFQLVELIGKEETLKRIKQAIATR